MFQKLGIIRFASLIGKQASESSARERAEEKARQKPNREKVDKSSKRIHEDEDEKKRGRRINVHTDVPLPEPSAAN